MENLAKLTREMWSHSQNSFNCLSVVEELTEALEEYKKLLERQLLLNEADRNLINNGSEGYQRLQIDLEGISSNFIGSKSITLFENDAVAKKVLLLLTDENTKRLDELREILPTILS